MGLTPIIYPISIISLKLQRYFYSLSQILDYLQKYVCDCKEIISIGMNPGINPVEVISL